MSPKDSFKYPDDGFYQFIKEFYPNDSGAERIVKILESEFSTERINYLILAEILLILNRIDNSFAQLVFNYQLKK